MFDSLYLFVLATLALAISPGPDNIYVLTQSLVHGTKSGIATTAGLISGCIVHTALLAFGVSAIITKSESIFYGIKVAGAIYLFYLAYKVFTSPSAVSISTESTPKKNSWQLFKTGVVMNLLNPKVMIFFLAFFPGFLWNPDADTVSQFFILGIVFMITSFIAFSAVAFLAGAISSGLMKNDKAGMVLKWLQIVVFLGIAIYILLP
ncbi:MAG: LysE family translocator [Aureisphaera sp.]